MMRWAAAVGQRAGRRTESDHGRIPEERIRYVGNVMLETLVAELERARDLNVSATVGISGK